ncbi:helix-turn-helix domain-containing protein [Caproicibacter fermentans]|uniref:Helix-turn-helix domain-containing protein n=1 Tax=Caproicibacter fermentans TaxID=2576756 RepID=A0A7G8TD91_9FIRM|nr:helix-turn-helix domain-containing protein [Caproicibacter fermentans]QNK41582.1 helix-turn-helix domain-containing protein [Caproicibacter fermentans]
MESFYLCNTAALEARLSKSAFKVYSFLSLAANSKTRDSFYSRAKIAARCRISKSTVIRAVRELCQKGLLAIRRRFKENGRQTSNLYVLLDNQQLNISTERKQDSEINSKCDQQGIQGKIRLFKCNPAAHQADLPANALKVYTYLSLRANSTGEAFPSKREMAKDCKISVSTVFRAVKRLMTAGLLHVISQTRKELFGNNGTAANRYILKCPDPVASCASSCSQSGNCKHPAANVIHGFRILIALFFGIKRDKTFLFPSLTPSPMSWVTPLRTTFKIKTKQRKEYSYSILAKSKSLHFYSKLII